MYYTIERGKAKPKELKYVAMIPKMPKRTAKRVEKKKDYGNYIGIAVMAAAIVVMAYVLLSFGR